MKTAARGFVDAFSAAQEAGRKKNGVRNADAVVAEKRWLRD